MGGIHICRRLRDPYGTVADRDTRQGDPTVDSDEDMRELARSIRAYLPELIGVDRAAGVDGELAALLADEERDIGHAVADVIERDPATHDWSARFLPVGVPPDVAEGNERAIPGLLGLGRPPAPKRYRCPQGDFNWWRRTSGHQPPLCPTHLVTVEPLPDAGSV